MKKKIVLGLLISAFITLSFLGVNLVKAAFPGEGLTISPPINEPKIKPGQTVEQIIRVTNPTSRLVEVYPQVMDFKAKGEGGEPYFYTAENQSEKFSLAKWVSYNPAKIALTPEQVVEFKYTLKVPSDAEPGGHYGSIFFVSEPPKDTKPGSKVSIGSMIGSLVLLTVPGETIEKGIVEDFSAQKQFFFTGNKADITTKISNIGNVHFKPKGKIEIKNMTGKSVSTLTFNPQSGNVLPDSTRKFTNSWGFKWYQVGIYRAELASIYGISDKPLTGSYTLYLLPWWFLIVVAWIVVMIIILIVVIAKKRKKKRNSRPSQNNNSGNQAVLR
jgi:hypothetical protein